MLAAESAQEHKESKENQDGLQPGRFLHCWKKLGEVSHVHNQGIDQEEEHYER